MPRALASVASALLVGALVALGGPAGSQGGDDPPTEYLGLEINLFTETIGELGFFSSRRGEVLPSTGTPGQLGMRIWTLHWLLDEWNTFDVSFSWTPGELLGGYLFGEYTPRGWEIYGGTAPGLTLRFGERRQFQLGLSLGIGAGWLVVIIPTYDEEMGMSSYGLMFSPSLRLRYQSEGLLSYGLGLRALVGAEKGEHDTPGGGVAVLHFFFEVGFCDWVQPIPVTDRPVSTLAKWGHAAFWTGAALMGFGGIATWQAQEAGREDRRDESRSWAGGMYAGYLTGGALLVTGIVLWILSPGSEAAAPGAEVD